MKPEVELRDVLPADLPVFFEQQLDPEATRMAEFPARDHDAFMTHWAKCLADANTILRTILFRGQVAGSVVCWEQSGSRNVGYWLGRDYWGRGIATAALRQFLADVTSRPLYAHVARHNTASIRVLEKCGFDVWREAIYTDPDGTAGSELIMALGRTPS
jgi:RimJ/RimL family protein N-acetyltransferase